VKLLPNLVYRAAWVGGLAAASPAILLAAMRDRWQVRRRLWPERSNASAPSWWWHGASAGEVRALGVFWSALSWQGEAWFTVVSATTSAGGEMWGRLRIGDEEPHILPVDLPFAWERIMPRPSPRMVVLSEAELWPSWLSWLKRRACPVAVVSARLSALAAERLASWHLLDEACDNLYVAAQTETDAGAFRTLGVPEEQVAVTGSLKWPRRPLAAPEAVRMRLGFAPDEPVLVAGSLHRSELAPVVTVVRELRVRFPDLRCILAPRKAGDVAYAERLVRDASLPVERWSAVSRRGTACSSAVLLVDTMGDLATLYAAGSVAVIGGSWEPIGGHNPFEAAVYGMPVVYGPDMRQPGCELLEQTGQAKRLTEGWTGLSEALAERIMRPPRCSFPRYADPVEATWKAWRCWGLAPEGASVV